jgi:hypothetical protein
MCIKDCRSLLNRLHRDQSGSISLATVFALLLLTMLLGMVINVGRQVDNKVRLQNAADAATYSGGVVLARGMNALAYTNHMLCETLALTAFMREARDRHCEPLVPPVLAAWNNIGPVLARSGFEKFDRLGPAIPDKTQAEQRMVTAYGDWMAASSEIVLPVLEDILAQELIPQLQREVVAVTPGLAQTASAVIAKEHTGRLTPSEAPRGSVLGVLWRTAVDSVGGSSEQTLGTLPAVDPLNDTSPGAETYREQAIRDRDRYARHYLNLWNSELMAPFDQYAKMSQFGVMWRGFTCGQLTQLLQENASRNLPHLIRQPDLPSTNQWLERDYMFVGVAYRPKLQASMPRLFADSLTADNEAFAQGMLFVPRKRPVSEHLTLIPHFHYTNAPAQWNLWNQDWSFQLVPATAASVPAILQTSPQTANTAAASLRLPNLQNVDPASVQRLTSH